jgi:DNA helicase II / ATP-dependent DNA helicase PcrA
MPFQICQKRQAVIDAEGHVLVLGGPGAGKTTLALLKAKQLLAHLTPGQKVLFLSFSRAAVQQILARCREVLTREERRLIDVHTYHAFCWDLLQCHGRALHGIPLTMMRPGDEGRARTLFHGDWDVERRRLLDEESHVCFDLFAHAAARLMEQSQHLSREIGDLYPLVILDEFQDTDDDQWRLTKALGSATSAVFLADAEQRIYDFRPGVRPERIDLLRAELQPAKTDLEADNHRSGGSQIVVFANAVLRGHGPLPRTNDVVFRYYAHYPNSFNSTVHFSVANAFSVLPQKGIDDPTVAVLASSNGLIADVSDILAQQHGFAGALMQPIDHDVVWDAELSATAAIAVATALEYVSAPSLERQHALLLRVSDYWLVKKDWAEQHGGRGRNTAETRAARFSNGAERLRRGKPLSRGACIDLCSVTAALGRPAGDPVADWRRLCALFQAHDDLKELFGQVRMARVFRATDPLATALGVLWTERGSYAGAAQVVRRVFNQERLVGAEREPRGCVLMTLHKSKGKEFDGVIIIEGIRGGSLLRSDEAPQYAASRRLLRVGITRARKLVVLVRPQGAQALVA